MTAIDVKATVERFIDLWNQRDRQAWLDCLAENARHEEPAGATPRYGHAPFAEMFDYVEMTFDKSLLDVRSLIVCGNECAVYFVGTSVKEGESRSVDVIEIWQVDDAGKLSGVRAFVDPEQLPASGGRGPVEEGDRPRA